MRFKIISKIEYESLKKDSDNIDNYTLQISKLISSLDDKKSQLKTALGLIKEKNIESLEKDKLMERIKQESNVQIKKLNSRIGGIQCNLNKQKEKNSVLFEMNKKMQEVLTLKVQELKETQRQLMFYKKHRRAPSLEEYKNYINNRKECEKRLNQKCKEKL